ncbi:MAG: hypothetical protein SV760_08070, partial [Halobacteria archaeon]|nr:hypothetical protein [Halobacteria archaeon]
FVVAADFRWGVVSEIGIIRSNLVDAHATLGVFGAVLTTVIGALYQLSTMFTQTEVHGFGERIRSFETVGYPAGVVLLASGRLLGNLNLGRLGTLLILASL